MKERPILFNSEMVKAILEGRKTQTRRVVKPQPDDIPGMKCTGLNKDSLKQCPHGKPGDRLWVRETFVLTYSGTKYKATNYDATVKYKPSIHMPRWASRITLEITDVRVERLTNISGRDAYFEGMKECEFKEDGSIDDFKALWDSISKPEHSWAANPWVWVIEFKVL